MGDTQGCPQDLDPRMQCPLCDHLPFTTLKETTDHVRTMHPSMFVWWCRTIGSWNVECTEKIQVEK